MTFFKVIQYLQKWFPMFCEELVPYFCRALYVLKTILHVEKCQVIQSIVTEPFLELGDSPRGGGGQAGKAGGWGVCVCGGVII